MIRCLVLIALLVVATPTFAAEAIFPPGSRIGLLPPKDMAPSKRFTGFENPNKGASISFIEMPPEAYTQLASGLTAEALKSQGVTLKAREEIKLGQQKALLISGEQAAGGVTIRKWLLTTADSTMTAFVIAQSAVSKDGYTDTQMREALRSISIRQPLALEEQIAALPFHIADRAGFRPVRALTGNSLLLTDGPKDVAKDLEQPILIVASSISPPPPSSEARELFARGALTSNQNLKDVAIERSQSFRMKGDDWHETVARATDAASGQPVVVMQTIRFQSDSYLRMVGVTRADARDQVLPRFRAIIDSVEAKD